MIFFLISFKRTERKKIWQFKSEFNLNNLLYKKIENGNLISDPIDETRKRVLLIEIEVGVVN